MLYIGDVHGRISEYLSVLAARAPNGPSLQVGDMALGFKGVELPTLPRWHRFLRGNHDDPSVCRAHSNYAGDFGYDERYHMFFVSGAWSIDWPLRVEGGSWWRDEQLSYAELNRALDLYEEKKPQIVVTHDCPDEIGHRIVKDLGVDSVSGGKWVKTRTGDALQAMFCQHKPEMWIFGHYHVARDFEVKGTRFVCLAPLQAMDFSMVSVAE